MDEDPYEATDDVFDDDDEDEDHVSNSHHDDNTYHQPGRSNGHVDHDQDRDVVDDDGGGGGDDDDDGSSFPVQQEDRDGGAPTGMRNGGGGGGLDEIIEDDDDEIGSDASSGVEDSLETQINEMYQKHKERMESRNTDFQPRPNSPGTSHRRERAVSSSQTRSVHHHPSQTQQHSSLPHANPSQITSDDLDPSLSPRITYETSTTPKWAARPRSSFRASFADEDQNTTHYTENGYENDSTEFQEDSADASPPANPSPPQHSNDLSTADMNAGDNDDSPRNVNDRSDAITAKTSAASDRRTTQVQHQQGDDEEQYSQPRHASYGRPKSAHQSSAVHYQSSGGLPARGQSAFPAGRSSSPSTTQSMQLSSRSISPASNLSLRSNSGFQKSSATPGSHPRPSSVTRSTSSGIPSTSSSTMAGGVGSVSVQSHFQSQSQPSRRRPGAQPAPHQFDNRPTASERELRMADQLLSPSERELLRHLRNLQELDREERATPSAFSSSGLHQSSSTGGSHYPRSRTTDSRPTSSQSEYRRSVGGSSSPVGGSGGTVASALESGRSSSPISEFSSSNLNPQTGSSPLPLQNPYHHPLTGSASVNSLLQMGSYISPYAQSSTTATFPPSTLTATAASSRGFNNSNVPPRRPSSSMSASGSTTQLRPSSSGASFQDPRRRPASAIGMISAGGVGGDSNGGPFGAVGSASSRKKPLSNNNNGGLRPASAGGISVTRHSPYMDHPSPRHPNSGKALGLESNQNRGNLSPSSPSSARPASAPPRNGPSSSQEAQSGLVSSGGINDPIDFENRRRRAEENARMASLRVRESKRIEEQRRLEMKRAMHEGAREYANDCVQKVRHANRILKMLNSSRHYRTYRSTSTNLVAGTNNPATTAANANTTVAANTAASSGPHPSESSNSSKQPPSTTRSSSVSRNPVSGPVKSSSPYTAPRSSSQSPNSVSERRRPSTASGAYRRSGSTTPTADGSAAPPPPLPGSVSVLQEVRVAVYDGADKVRDISLELFQNEYLRLLKQESLCRSQSSAMRSRRRLSASTLTSSNLSSLINLSPSDMLENPRMVTHLLATHPGGGSTTPAAGGGSSAARDTQSSQMNQQASDFAATKPPIPGPAYMRPYSASYGSRPGGGSGPGYTSLSSSMSTGASSLMRQRNIQRHTKEQLRSVLLDTIHLTEKLKEQLVELETKGANASPFVA